MGCFGQIETANRLITRGVELFFAFGYVKNISIFVTSKLKALINCKKI